MISREETIEAYINIATMFGTKPTKELIKKIPKKELVDVCYRLYEIIEEREKRIDKAIEYLKQPYRDGFDYSTTTLLEILGEERQ